MRTTGLHNFPSALRTSARRVACEKGVTIFRTGGATHSVYFVESGVVRLVRFGRGGEEVVLHQARAGEFFAEASLDSSRYHCDAVSDSAVELQQVPLEALRELLDADRHFARQWEALLSRQLREVRARVERLSLKSARERVRHLLLSQGRGPQSEIVPSGTLKDLARDLGLSHEVLYRTLANMVNEGIIERDGTTLRFVGPRP